MDAVLPPRYSGDYAGPLTEARLLLQYTAQVGSGHVTAYAGKLSDAQRDERCDEGVTGIDGHLIGLEDANPRCRDAQGSDAAVIAEEAQEGGWLERLVRCCYGRGRRVAHGKPLPVTDVISVAGGDYGSCDEPRTSLGADQVEPLCSIGVDVGDAAELRHCYTTSCTARRPTRPPLPPVTRVCMRLRACARGSRGGIK